MFNAAAFVHSHIAHFYALAGPDFVVGPDADPAKRNILGVVEKVGIPIAGEVLKHRAIAQDIQIMVGGRSTHPVWTLPGGVSKGITEEQRKEIIEKAKSWRRIREILPETFRRRRPQKQSVSGSHSVRHV